VARSKQSPCRKYNTSLVDYFKLYHYPETLPVRPECRMPGQQLACVDEGVDLPPADVQPLAHLLHGQSFIRYKSSQISKTYPGRTRAAPRNVRYKLECQASRSVSRKGPRFRFCFAFKAQTGRSGQDGAIFLQ
jgi:hypothetical protein